MKEIVGRIDILSSIFRWKNVCETYEDRVIQYSIGLPWALMQTLQAYCTTVAYCSILYVYAVCWVYIALTLFAGSNLQFIIRTILLFIIFIYYCKCFSRYIYKPSSKHSRTSDLLLADCHRGPRTTTLRLKHYPIGQQLWSWTMVNIVISIVRH